MNVKVGKVVSSVEALQRLMAEKVSAATAFKLARISRQLETVVTDFEKSRIFLVEKYGDKKDDGSMSVNPENMTAFQAEFGELIESDITVELDTVPVTSLGEVKLSAIDVLTLDYILTE